MTLENSKLMQWEHKYHECLALEFNDPEYFEVHHILVLAYMLQTGAYSSEYFSIALDLLKKFLTESIMTKEFQSQFKTIKNNKSIQNSESNRNINKYQWNLDVMFISVNSAKNYCADVKLWAKDVLQVIEENIRFMV